jgi:hypothetical protein
VLLKGIGEPPPSPTPTRARSTPTPTSADNGCGQQENCGGCTAPSTCGGSGVPNVCGLCTSTSQCPADQTCVARACVPTCTSGDMLSSGLCVNPLSDPNNCGGCGKACSAATPACVAGECTALLGPGKTCSSGGQCASGLCQSGVCVAPPVPPAASR